MLLSPSCDRHTASASLQKKILFHFFVCSRSHHRYAAVSSGLSPAEKTFIPNYLYPGRNQHWASHHILLGMSSPPLPFYFFPECPHSHRVYLGGDHSCYSMYVSKHLIPEIPFRTLLFWRPAARRPARVLFFVLLFSLTRPSCHPIAITSIYVSACPATTAPGHDCTRTSSAATSPATQAGYRATDTVFLLSLPRHTYNSN